MKRFVYYLLTACLLVGASGLNVAHADDQSNTGVGAGIGGVLGAVAGGVIGKQSHKTEQGAIIGGLLGAAAGALAGSQVKKDGQKVAAADGAIAKVSLEQIIQWGREGVSDDDVISRIHEANYAPALTKDDIYYLRKESVSDRVIQAMQPVVAESAVKDVAQVQASAVAAVSPTVEPVVQAVSDVKTNVNQEQTRGGDPILDNLGIANSASRVSAPQNTVTPQKTVSSQKVAVPQKNEAEMTFSQKCNAQWMKIWNTGYIQLAIIIFLIVITLIVLFQANAGRVIFFDNNYDALWNIIPALIAGGGAILAFFYHTDITVFKVVFILMTAVSLFYGFYQSYRLNPATHNGMIILLGLVRFIVCFIGPLFIIFTWVFGGRPSKREGETDQAYQIRAAAAETANTIWKMAVTAGYFFLIKMLINGDRVRALRAVSV
ncbi:MAG: glycine zipper domain-containing protein [Candidatus Omnitrophota bacterium]